MSRLRRALKKYQEGEDEDEDTVELLDSSVQDDMIMELRASLQARKTSITPSSKFINIIVAFVVCLNLMLLTIPYYKTKWNGVRSLLSIIGSLLNYVVLKFEQFQQKSTIFMGVGVSDIMERKAILLISIALSLSILLSKYQSLKFADTVYAVPLLNSFGLYLLTSNNANVEKEIQELEKLKYNYKGA